MNVIIRLQNLPWSANASDIRQFFRGLQIPEGGVHIVGGEDGDAFIAFSTDEDARQAMSMNRMKLKETQVSLLLSSRAEMQKVIEKARAASSFMGKAVSSSLPTPEAITNQFVTKKIDNSVLPPALVSNFLQMQQQPPPMSNSYQGTNGSIPGLGGGVTNAIPSANSSMQMFYNPVDYLKLVNQQQMQMQQQQQQIVQKLRDPREQSRYNRSPDRRQRSRSPYSRSQDSSENEDKKGRNRRTRFSSPEKKHPPKPVIATNNAVATAVVTSVTPQMSLIQKAQQQALAQQQQVAFSTNQQLLTQQKQQQTFALSQQQPMPVANNLAKSGIWDIPPPITMNSYSSFNQQQPSVQQQLPTRNNYQTTSNSNYQTSNSTNSSIGIGTCVKMANVDKETTYGDIRKFFAGLAIGNNDIKFVTNSKGGSTALVRFLSSDSKKQALTKNGWQLKSTQIFISSITEEDYENGLEGSLKSRSGTDHKKTYEDTRRDRYRERSDSRERDYDRDRDYERGGDRFNQGGNRNFRNDNRPFGRDNFNNRGGGPYNGGSYRGTYRRENSEGRGFYQRNRDDFNNQNSNNSNDNQPNQETPKIEYTPDENFTVLIIDDIPRVNEGDLFEAFPTIVSVTIERYTAYCKFSTHEEAKAVLDNRFSHFINKKRVFVEMGSEAQFDDLVKKFGKYDNPSMNGGSSSGSENGEDQKSSENKVASRDPRQRPPATQNGNGNSNGSYNFKTDCIIIKRMDRGAKIEDVENFLSDANIQKNKIRIHILLDRRGQPSGDCFVEFQFPDEIQRALLKNNQFMGQNRVEVMPIPREQVDAILNSFGADGPPQYAALQAQRRDWGPPPDFGSPDCVVMISNLSYRALVDDIVEAFREFDLKPDQIIRRFNDNGQPTGMACINFNCAEDATKACDEYNKVQIQGRPIWLKRV